MIPAEPVCDSHVHVFDPQRFPYAAGRRFTPGVATAAQLTAAMHAAGVGRVVLVQPSVYALDHGCLIDALRSLGDAARGVAVIGDASPDGDIAQLDAHGIRGARINLVVDHHSDARHARTRLDGLLARIPAHWHVQLHVTIAVLAQLAEHLIASGRIYVLDHFGLPDLARGLGAASWQALLQLLRSGRTYVKLSGPYLAAQTSTPYAELAPWVATLLAERPDRLLWGSNWPHTQGTARALHADSAVVEPFRHVNDLAWKLQCAQWAGAHADAVLARNARSLYGFT